MKKIFLTLVALALATSAQAAGTGSQAFAIYSGASAKVTTSAAYKVTGFPTKTLTVTGLTTTSTASSLTFKNMSGTAIVQCAPTSSGPWSTCVANDYAQTAVSKTTDGTLTWRDAVQYVRVKWTAGTVKTFLKAYLNWVDQ